MIIKKLILILIILILISSQQTSGAEENNSDKYTFDNYGGEEFTPQPMEFGENLKDQEKDESLSISTNERKHVLLQFYDYPTENQRKLLEQRGVQLLEGVAPYTVLVSMPKDVTSADLPAESGLRWMGPIPVENKYDRTYSLDVPAWARTENGEVKLAIHFYEDVDSKDSTSIVKKYSENYSTPSNFRPWLYRTTINETNITLIASEDAVQHLGYFGADDFSESDFVDYDTVTEEEAEITEYTFENYGREVYTPEPMEFGENIKIQEKNGLQATSETGKNATERKHVLLQFYTIPNDEQLELLEQYGVHRVGIAADYTYIFSMPASLTPADLPAESGLRWMGPILVENKYESLNVPERAKTENGQIELIIYFYKDVTSQEALSLARNYSSTKPQFYDYVSVAYGIVTDESNIISIASEDIVQQIGFPEPENIPADSDLNDSKQSPGLELSFVFLSILFALFIIKRRI